MVMRYIDNTKALSKKDLENLYLEKGLSMKAIATRLECSANRIVYWMDKYQIKRRTIGDAIYLKNHPTGDPFVVKTPSTLEEAQLFGLGIGLYWGEGTKSNKHSVRLGNTDPVLLNTFMDFLVKLCGIYKGDLRFGLQIFSDIDPNIALKYWSTALRVDASQFYKITVTISGSIGTYRKKSEYGVVTVHYHNRKLRDILVGMCRGSSVGRAQLW
jgi:hypothetical protein